MRLGILVLIGCSLCIPLSQPDTSNDATLKILSPSLPSQEPVVKTWHYDCTNTSGFQYGEVPRSFPIDLSGYDYHISTEGILESDAQCLYMTNITAPHGGNAQFYYGPIFMHDLPDTFSVFGLRNFSVQIELVNSNPEDRGAVAVGFFDETLSPVLAASCSDPFTDASGSLTWKYYPRNISVLQYYFGKDLYDYGFSKYERPLDFVNTTWSATYVCGQGIRGDIPAVGILHSTIVAENDTEYDRAIRYLGLTIAGHYRNGFSSVPPFRIHDIYLEYEAGGDIDTSPPLLTPQLDKVVIVGQTSEAITWKCHDDHPYRYWVLDYYSWNSDGSPKIIEEGLWNSTQISISIESFTIKSYYFILYLQDKAGFMVRDGVIVEVIEHPLISYIVSNPIIIVIVTIVVLGVILILRDQRKAALYRKERISLYQKQGSSAMTSQY